MIIDRNPLTLEVFGEDYPLYITRIIGEASIDARIHATHQYLQTRVRLNKTLPSRHWVHQIISSRLIRHNLFPTLVS